MKIDLFKIILKLLLIPLMCVSLIMLTDGSIDEITGNNVMGFILTIVSVFMAIIINIDNKRN